MRIYAYCYWLGVTFPTSLIVAMLVLASIFGQIGARLAEVGVYIGLIAFFTVIGSLLRPLRLDKSEIVVFITVGLVAVGILTFLGIMAASLAIGMLGD